MGDTSRNPERFPPNNSNGMMDPTNPTIKTNTVVAQAPKFVFIFALTAAWTLMNAPATAEQMIPKII
jgi:hypothetical protein